MINTEITIRSIQHYLYCPHRWGLIEINDCWAENIFVTKANFLHERVHDPDKSYSLRGKKVFTSVPIYNDLEQYNLYGVADCIEASKSGTGVLLPGYEDRYKLCIVEYKPSKPKNKEYNHDDLMQVFAQKICVDYLFNCDCDAVLYYADVKKRIPLPLRENFTEYDCELKELLLQIRRYIRKLLNSIYITNELAYLSLEGEDLVCKIEGVDKIRLPFDNIENIVCFNYNGCSPAVMGKCVSKSVPINLI